MSHPIEYYIIEYVILVPMCWNMQTTKNNMCSIDIVLSCYHNRPHNIVIHGCTPQTSYCVALYFSNNTLSEGTYLFLLNSIYLVLFLKRFYYVGM